MQQTTQLSGVDTKMYMIATCDHLLAWRLILLFACCVVDTQPTPGRIPNTMDNNFSTSGLQVLGF